VYITSGAGHACKYDAGFACPALAPNAKSAAAGDHPDAAADRAAALGSTAKHFKLTSTLGLGALMGITGTGSDVAWDICALPADVQKP
jgi:hypothetical protein